MPLTNTLAKHAGKMPSAPLIALSLTVALDNSYPAGGYAFDPAALLQSLGNYDKAPTVDHVIVEGEQGFVGEYDRANDKLKIQVTPIKNLALTSAGLAIGSVSKKEVLIANTVTFLTDGVFAAYTTAEVAFTATTHDIAPDALAVQERVYLYSLDSGGTVTVTAGVIATGAGNALVPAVPTGDTPFGYLRLAVAAGATLFNATTDDLDAGHLTDTYINLAVLPGTAPITEAPAGTDLSTTPGSLRVTILAS